MAAAAHTTEPKITIILPVYNVAEFLPRCLASIDGQTFRDFCVIAVNDGSTDNCPQILRDFAADHPYCTVVDQENQGLAQARNAGLALAKTEFVSFIDSDDFVESTFLEELYNACVQNDADIACCFHYYYYAESDRRVAHPFRCGGVYSRDEALEKLLQDLQLQSYAWNKLYRRRLFADNGITYPTMAFEDMATTLRLFQQSRRVAVINRPLYYYVQRKSSILKTPNPKKINDFIRATASMRVSLESSGEFAKFKRKYRDLCRKTHFYCNYYLVKYHLRNGSTRGMGKNLKRIRKNLQFYQSDRFYPAAKQGISITAMPDALPVGSRQAPTDRHRK